MKTLYLLRHAKSDYAGHNMRDSDRPLNKRGRQSASLMAKRLGEIGIRVDAVFSSPSRRTRETLDIFLPAIGFPVDQAVFEKDLYLAPARLIAEKVRDLEDRIEAVLFCGHNPGMEEASELFSGGRVEKFPTCGLYCLRFTAESWKNVSAENVSGSDFWIPKRMEKE